MKVKKMKNIPIILMLCMSVLMASCSGKARYETLGYISFEGLEIGKVLDLREEVLGFMKAQNCSPAQSNQTKFIVVEKKGKKPTEFVDIYDCKDNVFVFINQLNVTVSFYDRQKVKTQKWKALGQGLEALTLAKAPTLKMIWNDANIKANVVE